MTPPAVKWAWLARALTLFADWLAERKHARRKEQSRQIRELSDIAAGLAPPDVLRDADVVSKATDSEIVRQWGSVRRTVENLRKRVKELEPYQRAAEVDGMSVCHICGRFDNQCGMDNGKCRTDQENSDGNT